MGLGIKKQAKRDHVRSKHKSSTRNLRQVDPNTRLRGGGSMVWTTPRHFGYLFLQLQGTIGCTPNSVPMVFIVFSRDSWGL